MRLKTILWTLVMVLALIGTVAGKGLLFAYSPAKPGSQASSIIEVRRGQSPQELSRQLESQGVVSSAQDLLWLGKVIRQWPRVKAGEYKVSPAMTPIEVFAVLTSGISIAHPVTVREGENIYEIATELAQQGLATQGQFLQACRDPALIASAGLDSTVNSLEGYLFPDTYHFNRTMSVEDMVRQMVRRYVAIWSPEFSARAKELGMSRHQITILASMVEKETGDARERPLISSVLHNRLRRGMKLQSDPTTIYGIWQRYQGNIRKADLLDANPYNTYHVPALPVGPIGNPGVEAIRAALWPASTKYLFFVSHNDGTSEFSETLEQHNRAVRKFQLDPKAREGKSWRDASKTSSTQPSAATGKR